MVTEGRPRQDPGLRPGEADAAGGASGGDDAAPTVSGATEPGIVMGTVGYMSPEQALGKAVDFRSDQFSFGSILYEMATGRRAFARGDAPETLTAIIRDEPEPIGDIAPEDAGAAALDRRALPREEPRRPLRLDPRSRARSRDAEGSPFGNERGWRRPQRRGSAPAPRSGCGSRWRPWPRLQECSCSLEPGSLRRLRGPTRFLVDTSSSASFFGRPPVTGLAVSPDGRRIAFVAGSASRFRLWVRSLDEVEPRALPGTEWAASPFWSPDGRQVAFFAGGKLQRIAVAGGPPQVDLRGSSGSLRDVESGRRHSHRSGGGRAATANPPRFGGRRQPGRP